MIVAELRTFLSDLSKFLRASESAKAAGELEYLVAMLDPFGGQKVRAFADFIAQAEASSKATSAPARPATGKKAKPDPVAIEQACQHVMELYGRAIDPSVTVPLIDAAVKSLEDLDPTKVRLEELARQMGYSQKFKGKPDVLKAIRQKIIGRKGAFERPSA